MTEISRKEFVERYIQKYTEIYTNYTDLNHLERLYDEITKIHDCVLLDCQVWEKLKKLLNGLFAIDSIEYYRGVKEELKKLVR